MLSYIILPPYIFTHIILYIFTYNFIYFLHIFSRFQRKFFYCTHAALFISGKYTLIFLYNNLCKLCWLIRIYLYFNLNLYFRADLDFGFYIRFLFIRTTLCRPFFFYICILYWKWQFVYTTRSYPYRLILCIDIKFFLFYIVSLETRGF